MKISVCGSLTFFREMRAVQRKLESCGHQVIVPKSIAMLENGTFTKPKTVAERLDAESKHDFIRHHFRNVESSEAIVVVNPKKHGIDGYIGGNTFLEMGVAFYLGKPIYLQYPIPHMEYELEIASMRPVVTGGDWSTL